jgi:hypothetical protein
MNLNHPLRRNFVFTIGIFVWTGAVSRRLNGKIEQIKKHCRESGSAFLFLLDKHRAETTHGDGNEN